MDEVQDLSCPLQPEKLSFYLFYTPCYCKKVVFEKRHLLLKKKEKKKGKNKLFD